MYLASRQITQMGKHTGLKQYELVIWQIENDFFNLNFKTTTKIPLCESKKTLSRQFEIPSKIVFPIYGLF